VVLLLRCLHLWHNRGMQSAAVLAAGGILEGCSRASPPLPFNNAGMVLLDDILLTSCRSASPFRPFFRQLCPFVIILLCNMPSHETNCLPLQTSSIHNGFQTWQDAAVA
jgi:hypothetical protein